VLINKVLYLEEYGTLLVIFFDVIVICYSKDAFPCYVNLLLSMSEWIGVGMILLNLISSLPNDFIVGVD